MLSPPVPIPAQSYILAYHLRLQDTSARPGASRAFKARHWQIYNGRLYLPLLYFRCNCFRVFTNARHRAHAGATYRCAVNKFFLMSSRTLPPLTRSPSPNRCGKDQRNKLTILAHLLGELARACEQLRGPARLTIHLFGNLSRNVKNEHDENSFSVIPDSDPESLSKMEKKYRILSPYRRRRQAS